MKDLIATLDDMTEEYEDNPQAQQRLTLARALMERSDDLISREALIGLIAGEQLAQ